MENSNLRDFQFFSPEPLQEDQRDELRQLGIRWVPSAPEQIAYLRRGQEGGASILVMPSGLSLGIDFRAPKYQRKFRPANELLCRACGWHLGLRSLWDLTAGLGVDSMMLAQAGFQVRAFERHPYLVFLLREAKKHAGIDTLMFELAESEAVLRSSESLPEVLYYDPMYPGAKKTALPSKEMQILRELNGTDGENVSLLTDALKAGVKRVVVKRSLRAAPIIPNPRAMMRGKLIRFDIY